MGTVNRARVSWVRTRSLPSSILGGNGRPDLARQWDYREAFQQAGGAADWILPWVDDASFSHLWESNLGGGYRDSTNWDRAWKRVVPLKARKTPHLSAIVEPEVYLRCEQFLFPSGVAVLVTAEVDGELSHADLLEIAEVLDKHSTICLEDQPAKHMSATLGSVLDNAETKVFGCTDSQSVSTRGTETLTTVVSTTGASVEPVVQGDETHTLLSGLCQLISQVSPLNVGVLSQALIAPAGNHPGTARLRIGKGRAVWSPILSNVPEMARKLLCFHGNVALSTLQVDLMLNTVRWAANLDWRTLPSPAADLLRPQLNLLGLLYGKTEVYTTRFVRLQIEESGLMPQISEMRLGLGVGRPLG